MLRIYVLGKKSEFVVEEKLVGFVELQLAIPGVGEIYIQNVDLVPVVTVLVEGLLSAFEQLEFQVVHLYEMIQSLTR